MIYAMSDLHLPSKLNKSMDIFGWGNHVEKIKGNWSLTEDDTIIMPGDLSWGLKADDIIPDLEWLSQLPGKKIILKGNHDLWWNSQNKVANLIKEYGMDFVHNNSIVVEGISICGTRGWDINSKEENDIKILNREIIRLKLSLDTAKTDEKIVFMHYPPTLKDNNYFEFEKVFKEYGIKNVYFGHLHGKEISNAVYEKDGIQYHCVSSDQINFKPIIVKK